LLRVVGFLWLVLFLWFRVLVLGRGGGFAGIEPGQFFLEEFHPKALPPDPLRLSDVLGKRQFVAVIDHPLPRGVKGKFLGLQ
jgi:hypothetical protein